MASDESLTMVSSCIIDDDFEDTDDGFHQSRHSSLSRLSICTSSLYDEDEDEDNDAAAAAANSPSDVGMFMSGLSLESFDGAEADGEVSDVDKGEGKEEGGSERVSSDSDKGARFYALPETPSRRRRKIPEGNTGSGRSDKERKKDGSKKKLGRERRDKKASWMVKGRVNEEKSKSEDNGRDEWMLPGRVSGSALEIQTSSGGNSPIANWRISSPGDDPREVKARLKLWAQAVALASASRHAS